MQKIVLAIVRNSADCVLIIQRPNQEKGMDGSRLSWAFPGGKIEPGETKEVAVVREVMEETGYQIEAKCMIHEKAHPQFPVYIYYIEGVLLTEEQKFQPVDNQISAVQWVKPSELDGYFSTQLDNQVTEYLKI